MLRMRNKYCSNCLSTQRFLDLGSCLVCERCSKRLEFAEPRVERPQVAPPGARLVAWADRPGGDSQREAI